MTLLRITGYCLMILFLLAACGPGAGAVTPTPSEAPTQPPTNTPEPTATLSPSDTPAVPTVDPAATLDPAATADPGAQLPAGTEAAQPTAAQPAASAGGAAPEQYTYLGQSIPDRTQFLPNRTVTITWTVQNSGTVGWTTDYTLRYFAGPQPERTEYNFTKDVPPNDTINFTVTFTTPSAPGDYDLWFKLTNASGQNFGDLDFLFTVSQSPSQATSTPAQ